MRGFSRSVVGWYAALGAVCLLWGTIPFVIRGVDLDGIAIAFVRVWVASAGLAVILAVRGRHSRGVRLLSRAPLRCVASGAILALHWSAMFAAYKRAPADMVIFILYLAPVAIAALAPAVLAERVTARTVAALAVALGGAALVTRPAAGGDTAGLLLAGVAAGSFAALILVAKPLAQIYGGLRLTLIEMTVAGVALLPVAVFLPWGTPARSWMWLVGLGLVHTAVGTALYFAALARLPATHAGILGYLEPVGVVLFGWVLLGLTPARATVAGGALIVAAGIAVVRLGVTSATGGVRGAPEEWTHVPG